MRVNFFILGAARCGTTSLHYYLDTHPDIAMSAIKEPNHFLFRQTPAGAQSCIDDRRIEAKSVPDPGRYEALFAGPVRVFGDASPLYLYTRETPALIRAAVPDARLLAVVREPVERAWSHFVYVAGELHEGTGAAFAAAVRAERPLGYAPYRSGTHFLRLSAYGEQLRRYREQFPRDRLLVVRYEDLVVHPDQVLRRICSWLGVDDTFGFDTSVRYNPSSGTGTALARVDRVLRPAYPHLKRMLPARLVGPVAARRARLRAGHRDDAAASVPEDLRAELEEHFAADLEWLRREEGVSWSRRPAS